MCINKINLIEIAVFVAFAVPLCVCDMKMQTVPRFVNRAAFVVLFVFRLIFLRETVLFQLCAALAAEAFMIFVRLVTRGGVGKGDVFFAGVCGLLCGKNVFVAFVLAAALAVFAVILRFPPSPPTTKLPPCNFVVSIFAKQKSTMLCSWLSASILRGIHAATMTAKGRLANIGRSEKNRIPFIPFLCAGSLAVYVVSLCG